MFAEIICLNFLPFAEPEVQPWERVGEHGPWKDGPGIGRCIGKHLIVETVGKFSQQSNYLLGLKAKKTKANLMELEIRIC